MGHSPEKQDDWLVEALQPQNTYRTFLKTYLKWMKQFNPRFSYGVFAKKCGFASRNYPRDIVEGQKRITPKTLPAIIKAVGMNADVARYFTLLVAKEEQECNPDQLSAAAINQSAIKISQKIREKLNNQIDNAKTKKHLYKIPDWPTIYAALGGFSNGAGATEIALKMGRPLDYCQDILEKMHTAGHVRKENERYVFNESTLQFLNLSTDTFFEEYFLLSLERTRQQAKKHMKSDEHLFLTSTISVKKSSLPQVKAALKTALCQFIEQAEDGSGDAVVQLTVGMGPCTP